MQKARAASADIPLALKNYDALPDSAEVRLPIVAALFACSNATVWRRVRSGDIPAPERRHGITSWRVGRLRHAQTAGDAT